MTPRSSAMLWPGLCAGLCNNLTYVCRVEQTDQESTHGLQLQMCYSQTAALELLATGDTTPRYRYIRSRRRAGWCRSDTGHPGRPTLTVLTLSLSDAGNTRDWVQPLSEVARQQHALPKGGPPKHQSMCAASFSIVQALQMLACYHACYKPVTSWLYLAGPLSLGTVPPAW